MVQALDYAQQAEALGKDIGHPLIPMRSRLLIALTWLATGRTSEARQAFDRCALEAEPAGDVQTWGLSLGNLALLDTFAGETEKALKGIASLWKAYEESQLMSLLGVALYHGALAYSANGDYAQAIDACQRGMELWEKAAGQYFGCQYALTLAQVRLELADWPTALEGSSQALEAAQKAGNIEVAWGARITRGRCYLDAGDFEAAEEQLTAILAEIELEAPQGQEEARLRYSQDLFHAMGELSLCRGDGHQGLGRAARCVELAEATGMAENLVKGLRLPRFPT